MARVGRDAAWRGRMSNRRAPSLPDQFFSAVVKGNVEITDKSGVILYAANCHWLSDRLAKGALMTKRERIAAGVALMHYATLADDPKMIGTKK